MRDENLIILIGRIVSDIAIEDNGKWPRSAFKVKTKVKKDNKIYESEHEIVAVGEKSVNATKKLSRGDRVYLKGSIRHDRKVNLIDMNRLTAAVPISAMGVESD